MKTITLDKIDKESCEEILNSLYNEDGIILIVASGGGILWYKDILIKELNKHKDKVIMYGCEMLSAAFDLFNDFEGEKHLVELCNVMIHKADSTADISWSNNKGFIKRLEQHNKLLRYKVKDFLTKKELQIFDRGEEVWIIDEDRIKLIFGL